MTEKQPRTTDGIRKRKMSLVERREQQVWEMATAVRRLGRDADGAQRQIARAARLTGLDESTVGRLRWRKIPRIYGDVLEAVREAVARFDEKQETKAREAAQTLSVRLGALARMADHSGDPDFYSERVAGVVREAERLGLMDRSMAEDED